MLVSSAFKDAAKRAARSLIPAAIRFQRSGRAFLAGGEKEVHELPGLVEPGTVAIDVGALVGDYAYTLCNLVGHAGLVVCVEPQPDYARVLRSAARRLKLPMQVVECALSSSEGVAELRVPIVDGRQKNGFASLNGGPDGGKPIRVAVRTLDTITDTLDRRVSFLKVDVEGHELEVFRGALETLHRHRPNLLVEIEERHSPVPITETFAFLCAQGYAGWFLDDRGDRVPLERFDAARNAALASGDRTHGTPAPGYVANFLFTPA